MPRPVRAQGRPGTRVIPANWEESHAVVVNKTHTAVCSIYPATAAGTNFTVNADLTVTGGTPAAPLYTGLGCRLQVLNAQEAARLLGDQVQVTVAYLVAVDREVNVPHKAVIHVTECSDPTFVNRRLVVRKISRGSLTFERDLYAVEDQTAPPPA